MQQVQAVLSIFCRQGVQRHVLDSSFPRHVLEKTTKEALVSMIFSQSGIYFPFPHPTLCQHFRLIDQKEGLSLAGRDIKPNFTHLKLQATSEVGDRNIPKRFAHFNGNTA